MATHSIQLTFDTAGDAFSLSPMPAVAAQPPALPLIAFYGDSTQWGLDGAKYVATGLNTRADHPATDYVCLCGYAVSNRGVKSTTSRQLLDGDGVNQPWTTEMADPSISIVVVNHAQNDGASIASGAMSFADYNANLRALRDAAIAAGKTFIFQTPNICNTANVPQLVDNVRAMATERGNQLIDLYAFGTQLAIGRTMVEFCPDGVHPNQWYYRQNGLEMNRCLNNIFP